MLDIWRRCTLGIRCDKRNADHLLYAKQTIYIYIYIGDWPEEYGGKSEKDIVSRLRALANGVGTRLSFITEPDLETLINRFA